MLKQYIKFLKEFINMTRTEYINFITSRLFELFPNLSECRYSYDELSEASFIYIPSSNIFNNEEFVKFSAETSINYYESGLGGTIAFISEISDMEYLEFRVIKNSYLITTDDLIERMYFNPITVNNFLIPDFNTYLMGLIANNEFFASVQTEDFYALAA